MKTKHTLVARCYDKKGRLLSEATNRYDKTHPIQAYFAARVEVATEMAVQKRQRALDGISDGMCTKKKTVLKMRESEATRRKRRI